MSWLHSSPSPSSPRSPTARPDPRPIPKPIPSSSVGVEDTKATREAGVVDGEDGEAGVGDVNQQLKNKSYTIIKSSVNNENNNNSNEINNNSSYNNRNKHQKSVIQLQCVTYTTFKNAII